VPMALAAVKRWGRRWRSFFFFPFFRPFLAVGKGRPRKGRKEAFFPPPSSSPNSNGIDLSAIDTRREKIDRLDGVLSSSFFSPFSSFYACENFRPARQAGRTKENENSPPLPPPPYFLPVKIRMKKRRMRLPPSLLILLSFRMKIFMGGRS